MAICPIMSYRNSANNMRIPCIEKRCALAGANGECLISQALQRYIKEAQTTTSANDTKAVYFKPPRESKIP